MGEADTRSRPQNSLLEEDLEFERTMKPTPVITEEAVQSLEQLIKARILENNFDDVVRLRAVDDKPFLPSRLLELKDTQSQQSLAQIYEGEYMAAQAGGSLPDDRDGKLAKEHEEIEAQWDKICSKLDALSNAHFVPKLVGPSVSSNFQDADFHPNSLNHSSRPSPTFLQRPWSLLYQPASPLRLCWLLKKCSLQPPLNLGHEASSHLKRRDHFEQRRGKPSGSSAICWTRRSTRSRRCGMGASRSRSRRHWIVLSSMARE